MKNRNLVALSIFVAFYIVFGAVITIYQERIIYRPDDQDFYKCERLNGAKAVTHLGTRMYVKDIDKPVAILYHGNAGSACDRDLYANLFSSLEYGYILVEYSGYSDDVKKPTHELIKKDVTNIIDYLEQNQINNVTIIGESIGTGLASYHTSIASPTKLILISPFTNLSDVAANRFWFYPARWLVNDAFVNTDLLNRYQNKSLIIHGTNDSIIPDKLGRQLHESLSGEAIYHSVTGAGHNDLFTYPETYSVISEFLKVK